jgi:hypothetical protein
LISDFVGKIGELRPQLITFNVFGWLAEAARG